MSRLTPALTGRIWLIAGALAWLACGCSDEKTSGGDRQSRPPADDAGLPQRDVQIAIPTQDAAEPGPADAEGQRDAGAESQDAGPDSPGQRAVEVVPQLLDFGFLAAGNTVARTIAVRSTGSSTLTITEVSLTFDSSRDFRLTGGPELPFPLAPGEVTHIEVTYAQAGPAGDQGALFIQSDADSTPRVTVLLRARQKVGPPDIHVDPPALFFGQLGQGANAELELNVTNVGGTVLEVQEIGLAPNGSPAFSLIAAPAQPFNLEPGAAELLRIAFSPPGPGLHESSLLIRSDDPNEAELNIPLHGGGVDQPVSCLRIAPNPLRFGAVRRGDVSALTTQLISCGQAPLTITSLERSQFFGQPLTDEFEITAQPAWPALIAPGDSVEVEVSYSPRLAGLDLGHFIVHNNSPQPQGQLNLQAEGLPPRLEDVQFHIRLDWDTDGCDVDLHLLAPGGQLFDCDRDCHYQVLNPDWGVAGDFRDDPFLDVDNVQGFGPENINLEQPTPGTYRVVIHYYLDHVLDEGPSDAVETDARVRIYLNGNANPVLDETRHLVDTDDTWEVAEIDWPAAVVRPIHNMYEFDRANIQPCFGGFGP